MKEMGMIIGNAEKPLPQPITGLVTDSGESLSAESRRTIAKIKGVSVVALGWIAFAFTVAVAGAAVMSGLFLPGVALTVLGFALATLAMVVGAVASKAIKSQGHSLLRHLPPLLTPKTTIRQQVKDDTLIWHQSSMAKTHRVPDQNELKNILAQTSKMLGQKALSLTPQIHDGTYQLVPATKSRDGKICDAVFLKYRGNFIGRGGMNTVDYGWQIEKDAAGNFVMRDVALREERRRDSRHTLAGEDVHQSCKDHKHKYESRFIEQPALGFSSSSEKKILAKELMPQGDLFTHKFSTPRALTRAITGMVIGVKHLHQADMISRDIKPDNFLLNEQDIPLLSDLDLAGPLQDIMSKPAKGTPFYFLPYEATWQQTKMGDMYAVGRSIQLLLAKHGYIRLNEDRTMTLLNPEVKDLFVLASDLTNSDPQKRPTAETALERLLNMDSDARFIYKAS